MSTSPMHRMRHTNLPSTKKRQLIKTFRPVSPLPIHEKTFGKKSNSPFKYLDNNDLLSSNQSGFHPNDSSACRLLFIVHGIYKTFDVNPSLDVQGIFLDISNNFYRVWHGNLLF